MYYIHMAQPKIAPKSFRPGDERWARITSYAAEHKLSPHLAILLMLDEGYRSLTKLEVTYAAAVKRRNDVEGPKMQADFDQRVMSALTMPRAAPGSRLKKPKGAK